MQEEYSWNRPKDRRQEGKGGDTADRIRVHQIEPEDVADERNDNALKQDWRQDRGVNMVNGGFPEKHAQGEKDRDRKNRLIKKGVMMSNPSHQSLPDINCGDRPQDGCHEGKQIPSQLRKWRNSEMFAEKDDDTEKGQKKPYPFWHGDSISLQEEMRAQGMEKRCGVK